MQAAQQSGGKRCDFEIGIVQAFDQGGNCGPGHVAQLGKGDDRPINTLADRLAVVAALESVALVTWFDEDTPIARILESRPEHLVKGGDWAVDRIVGAREVESWGGKVHSIAFEHDQSTTRLLARIRT